jgi:hypothetical protein
MVVRATRSNFVQSFDIYTQVDQTCSRLDRFGLRQILKAVIQLFLQEGEVRFIKLPQTHFDDPNVKAIYMGW